MPTGIFPESLSQAMSVGVMLVGGLGVWQGREQHTALRRIRRLVRPLAAVSEPGSVRRCPKDQVTLSLSPYLSISLSISLSSPSLSLSVSPSLWAHTRTHTRTLPVSLWHYYYKPLKNSCYFRCLRFVDIHCCPAVCTGRDFFARRAAVWHWSWPYISQHQPKDPKIKSNQKPEEKHVPL